MSVHRQMRATQQLGNQASNKVHLFGDSYTMLQRAQNARFSKCLKLMAIDSSVWHALSFELRSQQVLSTGLVPASLSNFVGTPMSFSESVYRPVPCKALILRH